MLQTEQATRKCDCNACGQERHTTLVMERSMFTAIQFYRWLCLDCLQRQWYWCYWLPAYQQTVFEIYAAAAERDQLEHWLSWTFGQERYQALCAEAVTL